MTLALIPSLTPAAAMTRNAKSAVAVVLLVHLKILAMTLVLILQKHHDCSILFWRTSEENTVTERL